VNYIIYIVIFYSKIIISARKVSFQQQFFQFYWGLDLWTNFATALHILSFAILRLIGVSRPTLFRQISSRKLAVSNFNVRVIYQVTFCGDKTKK